MRDDLWLTERFQYLRDNHFSDITEGNEVVIKFGQKARNRLGSITLRHKSRRHKPLTRSEARTISEEEAVSVITINGHFRDPERPEMVIDAIIAHEYSHYIHGFNSTRPRLHTHPHAGGVVDREIRSRALGHTLIFQKQWLAGNWAGIIGAPVRRRRKVRRVRTRTQVRRVFRFLGI